MSKRYAPNLAASPRARERLGGSAHSAMPETNIPALTPNTSASAALGSAPCRTSAFDQLLPPGGMRSALSFKDHRRSSIVAADRFAALRGDPMHCPKCMADNAASRRFCAECGAPLPLPYPDCGFENEPTAKFCGGCGKPLGGTAAAIPPAAPPRVDTAERRQLTVMFCDLVGSTALASRLDPEDLREVIGAYHHCVAETISRFDGFVAKYMGDGVLAYFGYPQAHEDDAERAVRAGLAVI